MEMNKMNWGQIIIGIIIGALAMWAINAYTQPATGTVVGQTYTGTIISVNKAMQAGKIQGDVVSGASVQEYQFQIPEDLAVGYSPVVGDKVQFDVSPYQAQDVNNIRSAKLPLAIVSFAAQGNLDGSHQLIWSTTGAVSGMIRYYRLDNGAKIDIDITSTVNAGTTAVGSADIANANGYTLFIFEGPDYSGFYENQNAKI